MLTAQNSMTLVFLPFSLTNIFLAPDRRAPAVCCSPRAQRNKQPGEGGQEKQSPGEGWQGATGSAVRAKALLVFALARHRRCGATD